MIQKFRAWYKKEKKMYEVACLFFQHRKLGAIDIVDSFEGEFTERLISVSPEEVILMQSLVRRDRRARGDSDVFEGDFVRIISSGYSLSDIHIVVKDDLRGFLLQGLNHTTKKFGDMLIKRHMRFEVLGDIHKDTEMLKDYWKQGEMERE